MNLPARAAAIRGDDYQHAIAWYWACEMLCDPDIESITLEFREGGAFDDVVVKRRQNADTHIQAKSSNYGNTIIDQKWLFSTKSKKGKSPLQHFYATYQAREAEGAEYTLEVWTNRGFDHKNKLLGELLDQKSETIAVEAMLAATTNTGVGIERDAWAVHLGIDADELGRFLRVMRWKQAGSEADWRRQAKPLMKLAGLRSDDEAVESGIAIVRHWVTDGADSQTADGLRAEAADHKLLAMEGTLVLAVHGIDRDPSPTPPNVELDFIELYDGSEPFARKLLKDPEDWQRKVMPEIEAAARILSSYQLRSVHVVGSIRHPMWFAIGRTLPQVKKWTLSTDQVGGTWSTSGPLAPAKPRILGNQTFDSGTELAIGIGLTGDPTTEIERHVRGGAQGVGRLVVFGPESEPSPTAVPSGPWAMNWTRSVRDQVRAMARELYAQRIHLYTLCPSGIALLLGHQWNTMPTTTIYEFSNGTYHPTITVASSL